MPPVHPIITPSFLTSLRATPHLPRRTWYFISTVTLSMLNRPEEIWRVFTAALENATVEGRGADVEMTERRQTGHGEDDEREDALLVARKTRDALIKSIAVGGLPKVRGFLFSIVGARCPCVAWLARHGRFRWMIVGRAVWSFGSMGVYSWYLCCAVSSSIVILDYEMGACQRLRRTSALAAMASKMRRSTRNCSRHISSASRFSLSHPQPRRSADAPSVGDQAINSLYALKRVTPAALLDDATDPSPTLDRCRSPEDLLAGGQSLFDRVYGKVSTRVMSQMDRCGTPDLGIAARWTYGGILSGGQTRYSVLSPMEISFVLMAGLIPQDVSRPC